MGIALAENPGSGTPSCRLYRGKTMDAVFPGPVGGQEMTADTTLVPAGNPQAMAVSAGDPGEPDRPDPTCLHPASGWSGNDDLRWYFMNKYRVLLADPVTAGELELLACRRRPGEGRGSDGECLRRFVRTLQRSVPDDILRQEIAGIAALVAILRPEDLPALRRDGREAQGRR